MQILEEIVCSREQMKLSEVNETILEILLPGAKVASNIICIFWKIPYYHRAPIGATSIIQNLECIVYKLILYPN